MKKLLLYLISALFTFTTAAFSLPANAQQDEDQAITQSKSNKKTNKTKKSKQKTKTGKSKKEKKAKKSTKKTKDQ
jgi:hypothetical protein